MAGDEVSAADSRLKRGPQADRSLHTLMLVVALLAIGPVIVAVMAMMHVATNGLEISSAELAQLSQETRGETPGNRNGSEKRSSDTNTSAGRSAVSEALMGQIEQSTEALGSELLRVSNESNAEMVRQTAKVAETVALGVADSLVEQASKNTQDISRHVVEQNVAAAKHLSERLLRDGDREPAVNFKQMATIVAQGLASDHVAPIQDGYMAVVDARGSVITSTRYKPGASLNHLAIVGQALEGATPEDSLVRFSEGKNHYVGVFARRPAGGAVIFAYLADRARVDTEPLQADVQRTLTQMGSASSAYVVKRLDAQKPLLRADATRLSRAAVATLTATNEQLTATTAARMQKRSDAVSARTLFDMAVMAQTPAADTALSNLAGEAPAPTGLRVEQARGRADAAVTRMWLIAGGLLAVEIVLVILAALMLSGRIAVPLVARVRKARDEQAGHEREREIASRLQSCLQPPTPTLANFDIALARVPAHDVGGDFVDLVPLPGEPGAFWIGLGDVTGHGLMTGLITMMAQSTFQAFVQDATMTPKRLYDGMNRVLYQNIKDRLRTADHLTLSVLKHVQDGQFVHCGSHLDILIYRAATEVVERIETAGPWVGVLPECGALTGEIAFKLEAQDVLLLYTDGLIGVQDAEGEPWDMDRLCAALRRHALADAQAIQMALLKEATAWAPQVRDDMSLVVVKRLPKAAPRSRILPSDGAHVVLPIRMLSKLGRRNA